MNYFQYNKAGQTAEPDWLEYPGVSQAKINRLFFNIHFSEKLKFNDLKKFSALTKFKEKNKI